MSVVFGRKALAASMLRNGDNCPRAKKPGENGGAAFVGQALTCTCFCTQTVTVFIVVHGTQQHTVRVACVCYSHETQ